VNRFPRSFAAKVESTNVLRGLPVASDEAVEADVEPYQAWMR
jgi:hypothetical protein